MGAELAFIDANLSSSFQREAFDMVIRYRDLQPSSRHLLLLLLLRWLYHRYCHSNRSSTHLVP